MKKKWILVIATVVFLSTGIILHLQNGHMFSAGDFCINYFAAGDFAVGVFAAGKFSIGIFSAGIFSIGIFSIGIFNVGLLALGIFVFGWKTRLPTLLTSLTKNNADSEE